MWPILPPWIILDSQLPKLRYSTCYTLSNTLPHRALAKNWFPSKTQQSKPVSRHQQLETNKAILSTSIVGEVNFGKC